MNLSWFMLQTGGPHMKLSAGLVVAVAILALAPSSWAAPGDLDLSFGSEGILLNSFGGAWPPSGDVAVQADGKIVVVGDEGGDWAISRFNADGSPDTTFSGDGR